MTVKVCKRGGEGPRDKWGHCLCAACKAARKAAVKDRTDYHRKWRANNPDKVAESASRWLSANPEKRAATVSAWQARNPDKRREITSRAGKKWSANNKDKVAARVRWRQAAKKQRLPPWADKAKITAFYTEAHRLSETTGVPHEVDHIIPLQGELVSGLHVHTNLQILPRSVNRAKRNKYRGVPCES